LAAALADSDAGDKTEGSGLQAVSKSNTRQDKHLNNRVIA
jgi:hypothetical protein